MRYWDGYMLGGAVKAWEQSTGENFFDDPNNATRSIMDSAIPYNQHFMYGFDQFVQSYYNCNLASLDGATIISQNSNSEEEAFDKFFELLDDFFKHRDVAL